MNLDSWIEADRVALRAFYEAGQAWSWQEIFQGASEKGRAVQSWIENSPLPRSFPIFLPVQRIGQSESQWFAIAFSEAQCEELREHLTAFLGPAGSDYRGRRADLNPADPVDSAASSWAGGPWVFRFSALPEFRKQVRDALERMRRVWRLQPTLRVSVFRTTEAMLRDFFCSLANGEEDASRHWLDEVRLCGRLSAENLHFLEIERLGVFRHWDQLALHPQLSLLVAMRRPRRITAMLIEALWHTELAEFVPENRVADALAFARDKFLPRYQGLLRVRGSLSQTPVLLAFLLAAVAMNPPRREQIPVLLAAIPFDAPERAFAEAVAAQVTELASEPPISDALELVRQALVHKDFDTAWLKLQDTAISVESCELRLDCAAELSSPEVARLVADSLAELPAEQLSEVLRLRRHARTWKDLESLLSAHERVTPVDWETWLDVVESDPTWERSLEVAHEGASEWPDSIYRNNPARVQEIADRFQAPRGPEADRIVRLTLPHVVRFFMPDAAGQTVYRPIYHSLLLILALDDHFGGEDWICAETLALAILGAGTSASDYQETVEALTSIWRSRGEVARLDWALDMLDTFVAAPVLSDLARDAFFTSVWQTFATHARRVRQEQRAIFELLCRDLNRVAEFTALPSPPPEEEVSKDTINLSERLRGKLVAIYTLTESAGIRAKNILEFLFDGLDVRLSHDHVGNDRLQSLARDADYFLVTTQSAKHAATGFIKSARTLCGREVIYPSGKGSSSIITALKEAVLRN